MTGMALKAPGIDHVDSAAKGLAMYAHQVRSAPGWMFFTIGEKTRVSLASGAGGENPGMS